MLGFAKNEKANINTADLADLKKQAKHILKFSRTQIAVLIDKGVFIKVGVSNE